MSLARRHKDERIFFSFFVAVLYIFSEVMIIYKLYFCIMRSSKVHIYECISIILHVIIIVISWHVLKCSVLTIKISRSRICHKKDFMVLLPLFRLDDNWQCTPFRYTMFCFSHVFMSASKPRTFSKQRWHFIQLIWNKS